MPMNKPHLEFHKVDMKEGWVTPPGYSARNASTGSTLAARLDGR